MPAADGTAAPAAPRDPRARAIERELAATSHAAARLPEPVLRRLTPALAQAQRETTNALRLWLLKANGADRYTAAKHHAVLAHLATAMNTIAGLDPLLRDALRAAGIDAGRLAVGDTVREIARLSALFDGAPVRVPVRLAAVLAHGERALFKRFATSAARYAGAVADDITRELAVGLLRRETVDEMVDRLARLGGPRGVVALRGVAGQPGAVVEHIGEGLFRRYRWWGERLARTETQAAYNAQVMESLRDARRSIPDLRRRWDASADLRICPRCQELHGAVVGLDQPFPGDVTDAPLHPACRCRVGAWRLSWGVFLD